MLMQVDYLRNQIDNCPDKCEGVDAVDDEGLCPTRCNWLAKVLTEEKRLKGDGEFHDVIGKLKQACDEDKSERYQRMLHQSREGKIIH